MPADLTLSALEDARVLAARLTGAALFRETSTAARAVVLVVVREPVAVVERIGGAAVWRVVVPRVPMMVAGCFAAVIVDRVVVVLRAAVG